MLPRQDLLTFYYQVTASIHDLLASAEELVPVTFDRTAPGLSEIPPDSFHLVIHANGWGTEKHSVLAEDPDNLRYVSLRFWDDDTLEQPNLGVSYGTVPRVLIAGGGDGGLQDFIRILTNSNPVHLIRKMEAEGILKSSIVWQQAMRHIHGAEEQFLRAFPLGMRVSNGDANTYMKDAYEIYDRNALALLHSAHIEAVKWTCPGRIDTSKSLILTLGSHFHGTRSSDDPA